MSYKAEVDKHIPAGITDLLQGLDFSLYGSRSMLIKEKVEGNHVTIQNEFISNSDRDWDFIVQDSAEARRILKKNYFTEIPTSKLYALDESTAGLYIREISTGIFSKKQEVQVILKHDVDLVRRAWAKIDTEFFCKYIWKTSPVFEWSHLALDVKREKVTPIMNQMYKAVRYDH